MLHVRAETYLHHAAGNNIQGGPKEVSHYGTKLSKIVLNRIKVCQWDSIYS